MRTLTPSSVALKASIRTSSSSSSTSLSRRGPAGRTLSDRTSCVLIAPGGPGLIVSHDDPVPARLMDGFALGGEVWSGVIRLRAVAASGFAALADTRAGPAFDFRAGGRGFPRLEELTPELPDPADRVRDRLERDHLRGPRGLDDGGVLGLRNPFGVDPDDPVVNAAFKDHQRPHARIALQAPRIRDLEPVDRDDVSLHETGDRHPRTLDVGLDMASGPMKRSPSQSIWPLKLPSTWPPPLICSRPDTASSRASTVALGSPAMEDSRSPFVAGASSVSTLESIIDLPPPLNNLLNKPLAPIAA